MSEQQESEQKRQWGDEVVAGPGRYYRNTRYIMVLVCVAVGLWFAYDGWVNWPKQNVEFTRVQGELKAAQDAGDRGKIAELAEEAKKYSFHDDFNIRLQKILACSLPPVGLLLLGWSIYRSRGTYRLAGRTLSVPGHPTIELDDITKIDKQLWDRKGIVYLHYSVEKTGEKGVIRLDDFLYDRPPTDEIFRRVEEYLLPKAEA